MSSLARQYVWRRWSVFAWGVALLSSSCTETGGLSLLLQWEGIPPTQSHSVVVSVTRAGSDVASRSGVWADGRMTRAPEFDDLGYDTSYVAQVQLFPCEECASDVVEADRPDYGSELIPFQLQRGTNLTLPVRLRRAPEGIVVQNVLALRSASGNAGVEVQSPVPGRVAHRCVALLIGAETASLPDAVEISSVSFEDAVVAPGSGLRRCRLPGAEPSSELEGAGDCGIEPLESDVAGVRQWRVPGWSLCAGEGICDQSLDGERGCPGDSARSEVYVRFSRGKLLSKPYSAPVELDLTPPAVSLTATPVQAGPSSDVCVTLESAEELADCGKLSTFQRLRGTNAEWQSSELQLTPILSADARSCRVCDMGGQLTEGQYIFAARVQDLVGNARCVGCDEACADGPCAPPSERRADVDVDTSPPVLSNERALVQQWRAETMRSDDLFPLSLEFDEAVDPVLSIDGALVPCLADDSRTRFRCELRATAELGDGQHSVVVRATDAVGNALEPRRLGVLVYDVEPPRVTTILTRNPAFSRLPGEVVWFTAQHPFDTRPVSADLRLFTNKRTVAPQLELVATTAPSGETCLGDLVKPLSPSDLGQATEFTFSDELNGWLREQFASSNGRETKAPALYCLRARFTDERGRSVPVDLTPRLGVAGGAPENGLDRERTTFRRAPWGSEEERLGTRDFSVLAYTHPDGAHDLRAGAAALPITDVVISSDAEGRARIGTREEAQGFAPQELEQGVRLHLPESLSPSLAEIYAASVDAAGRVSDFGLITQGEWLATLRQDGLGNPHHASAWGVAHATLVPPYSGVPIEEELARSRDGLHSTSQATVEWQEILTGKAEQVPAARSGHGMAYDAARGVTVVFGGEASNSEGDTAQLLGDTWEWDGLRWRQQLTAESPSARRDVRLAYDAARARVVLFGGAQGSRAAGDDRPSAETWLWDGRAWTKGPDTGPAARYAPALAYDPRHGLVVLSGGTAGLDGEPLGDTWLWNGSEWRRATDGPSSFRRSHHAMSFDAYAGQDGRGALLLFGGAGYDARDASYPTLADTWQWDGADWTLLQTEPLPAPRAQHTMVTRGDGRATVFGGAEQLLDVQVDALTAAPADQMLVFQAGGVGSGSWSAESTLTRPCRDTAIEEDRCLFMDHASAFDSARNQILLLGGRLNDDSSTPKHPETWILERERWREPASTAGAPDLVETSSTWPPTLPCARGGHSLVALPAAGVVALFGGEVSCSGEPANSTWSWDGTRWRQVTTESPPPRREHLLVELDGTSALLFGGLGGDVPNVPAAWELASSSGSSAGWGWTERSLGACDPRYNGARSRAAAADGGFLFGGVTVGTALSADLLHWSGSCWGPLPPGPEVPPERRDAALARVGESSLLLFSGLGAAGRLPDTWLYEDREGARGWVEVKPAAGEVFPVAREGHTLTSTPSGAGALLFGGRSARSQGQGLQDTWLFDGRTWIDVSSAREAKQPGPRVDHALALDPSSGGGLLFGGATETVALPNDETWGLTFPARPAHTALFDVSGLGCVAAQATPEVAESRSLVLTQASVRAIAGGGPGAPGAELWVWQGPGWALMQSNDAALAAPTALNWQTTEPQVLLGLAAGQTIGVQLRPRSGSALPPAQFRSDLPPAQLRSDLVELRLKYRLDERTAPALTAPLCFAATPGALRAPPAQLEGTLE